MIAPTSAFRVQQNRTADPNARRFYLLLLGVALVLVISGSLTLFSRFMFYDDEGYVLISLRNFAEHGRLYSEVYSQYGPAPYVFYYILSLLGFPLTHTDGRIVTIAFWLISSLLCADTVWQASRRTLLALAVFVAVFAHLWVMIKEPTHPGGMAAAVLAMGAAVGFRALTAERLRIFAFSAGLVTATLMLTKINLGVFAACSIAALLWVRIKTPMVRRFAVWILTPAALLLPVGLMHTLLAATWVQTYAVVFALSAVAVILVLISVSADSLPEFSWRHVGWFASGVCCAGGFILGIVLLRGTSVREMLDGIVLRPLRHPATFHLPFPWPPGTVVNSTAAFLAAAAAIAFQKRTDKVHAAVAAARLVAACGLGFVFLLFPDVTPHNLVFPWGLPWLWLFAWRLPGETSTAGLTYITLLALGQWLHAYPVAGSQIAWSTFLFLPVAALGAHASIEYLLPKHQFQNKRPSDLVAAFLLLGISLLPTARFVGLASVYWSSRPLNLPGAETIRIPDAATATYRILCLNAAVHGDVLFTFPGMSSLNLWSRLPTPTLANTTHWFSLLGPEQQRRIITALEAHPNAVLITHAEHIDYLRKHGFGPKGELHDYLAAHFSSRFRIDDFEFHVRNGRAIAPFFTAELLQRPEPATGFEAPPDTLLQIPIVLPAGQAIARIEIANCDDRQSAPLVLDASSARLEIAPITLEGAPTAAPQPARFPVVAPKPALLSVYFDHKARTFSLRNTLIVLRGADGAELALVRLRR